MAKMSVTWQVNWCVFPGGWEDVGQGQERCCERGTEGSRLEESQVKYCQWSTNVHEYQGGGQAEQSIGSGHNLKDETQENQLH